MSGYASIESVSLAACVPFIFVLNSRCGSLVDRATLDFNVGKLVYAGILDFARHSFSFTSECCYLLFIVKFLLLCLFLYFQQLEFF